MWLAVAVVALLLVLAVVVTFFRGGGAGTRRSKVTINAPFGIRGAAEASDEVPAGVRIHDARSEAGGLTAEDRTGRGVDVSKIVTRDDITVSNTPPPPADPKA